MKDNYTRVEEDLTAWNERQLAIRNKPKSQKNAISHEKRLKSKTGKCDRIQRGIRASISEGLKNPKGGVVYISNPSNNTQYYPPANSNTHIEVISFFPETVIAGIDENDNDIILPFQLPAWRDLNEKTKPYFYQLAMSDYEIQANSEYRLIPFVFNESQALTTAINSQKLKRVEFMRDRLQKALKLSLKRSKDNPVMFWFAFETARRGQPHYQGSVLLRLDELKKARAAFYAVNREMTKEEKRQALKFRGGNRRRYIKKYGRVHADLNWADYNLKEYGTTRRRYNNLTAVIAATSSLKKLSENHYKALKKGFDIVTKK